MTICRLVAVALSIMTLISCGSESETSPSELTDFAAGADLGESLADEEVSIEPGVVSDLFNLQLGLDGNELLFRLDTDLPDFSEVSVSVVRNYYRVGDINDYPIDYFSETKLVEEWRDVHRIFLDNDMWGNELRETRDLFARFGSDMAFSIDRIEEDEVVVSAVLHARQDDPRFGGNDNPALSGDAVQRSSGMNIIRASQAIEFPFSGEPVQPDANFVAFDGLQAGSTYCLLSETPVMISEEVSQSSLEEIMDTLRNSLLVPAEIAIRVEEIDLTVGLNPWYKISFIDNLEIVGWINSAALMPEGVRICN